MNFAANIDEKIDDFNLKKIEFRCFTRVLLYNLLDNCDASITKFSWNWKILMNLKQYSKKSKGRQGINSVKVKNEH